MENTQRMVKVSNMVNHKVILNDPSYGIKKTFEKKGSSQFIPFEVLQQMLWSSIGTSNLFKKGALYIESMKDKIELGLENEGTSTPTNIKVLTDAQILTLLKVKPMKEFIESLQGLPLEQINGIVDYAVEHQIIDVEKDNLLKELTGRDIIALVARRNEDKLIDEKIAAKEAARKREFENS